MIGHQFKVNPIEQRVPRRQCHLCSQRLGIALVVMPLGTLQLAREEIDRAGILLSLLPLQHLLQLCESMIHSKVHANRCVLVSGTGIYSTASILEGSGRTPSPLTMNSRNSASRLMNSHFEPLANS
jgi:hypothetical protein